MCGYNFELTAALGRQSDSSSFLSYGSGTKVHVLFLFFFDSVPKLKEYNVIISVEAEQKSDFLNKGPPVIGISGAAKKNNYFSP